MIGWIILALTVCLGVVSVVLAVSSDDDFANSTLEDVLKKDCPAKLRINWITTALALLLLFAAVVLGVIDWSNIETVHTEPRTEWVETSSLIAISTGNTTEGKGYGALTFFYGYLTTNDTYEFMYVTADGGYRKTTVDSDIVTLYELDQDNHEEPRMERWVKFSYTTTTRNEANIKFFRPFWRDLKPAEVETERGPVWRNGEFYKIYVPKGSIVKSYDVMG